MSDYLMPAITLGGLLLAIVAFPLAYRVYYRYTLRSCRACWQISENLFRGTTPHTCPLAYYHGTYIDARGSLVDLGRRLGPPSLTGVLLSACWKYKVVVGSRRTATIHRSSVGSSKPKVTRKTRKKGELPDE